MTTTIVNPEPMLDLSQLWGAKPDYAGALIAIEGFDGAGKSTQIALLEGYLRQRGHSVVTTRQPTDWYRQQPLVQLFFQDGVSIEERRAIALMSAADRVTHMCKTILPALRRGQVVITDRYVFSAVALFLARGVSFNDIIAFNRGIIKPDIAILLDVDATVAQRRITVRDGGLIKIEERSTDVVDAIVKLYRTMRSEFCIVNSAGAVSEIAAEIFAAVDLILPRKVLAH